MIVKLIGAASVIVAGTYIGFDKSAVLEKRLSMLRNILRMFDETEILMNYGAFTTGEILERLSENECFEKIINKDSSVTRCLAEDEKRLINEYFSQLGTTDLQGQLSALKMYKTAFAEKFSDLKAVKDEKCRLYRTMGILAALFVCVILV